jgi:sugar/nucleoside kinase (ribokinase family)
MKAVVFGNVTLDVICQTVDEVPRHESIAFDHVVVSPGGCGSNVAIGLAALGVSTILVARMGCDDSAELLKKTWTRYGVDWGYVKQIGEFPTGTSVGLVDSELQPRFIHTSGANQFLTGDDLHPEMLVESGANWLHIAGFFVLPGLLDERMPLALKRARHSGLKLSLDVVRSPRLKHPEYLWPSMSYLDVFFCNANEAWKLTGEEDAARSAKALREHGAGTAIIKLGAAGCFVDGPDGAGYIPAPVVQVVDTTGAGDAFAAGFIAASLGGANMLTACERGNQAGAKAVGSLGAVAHWLPQSH